MFSTLLAVVIGGFISLFGVRYAHRLDLKKAKSEQENEIEALIQSIKDEIETLREIYIESVGKTLEELEDEKPFKYYFIVTQEYFTVYSSNAGKIGMIENHELRKSIIKAYSAGRSMIDTYNANNDIMRTYDHNNWLFNITNNSAFKNEAEYNLQRLSEYSTGLKGKHDSFIEAVNTLLSNIEKFNT